MSEPYADFAAASHAVLEASILVSRAHLLPAAEVRSELARLQVLVDKTGGLREHEAMVRAHPPGQGTSSGSRRPTSASRAITCATSSARVLPSSATRTVRVRNEERARAVVERATSSASTGASSATQRRASATSG